MEFPDDEDYENEWDAMDSMQAEPPSNTRITASSSISASKAATEFKTFSRATPTVHSGSRQRCRSSENPAMKSRWTPYPVPQVQSSSSIPIRTENGSSQLSPLPLSGTYSLDLDGFEIAPATAQKLDKYRFTPSPEKKAHVGLPDVPKGAIDLTSPVKAAAEDAKVDSKNADVIDVGVNPSAQLLDTDRTMVAEPYFDAKESGDDSTQEVKPKAEGQLPLSDEQQKVLDMVMQGFVAIMEIPPIEADLRSSQSLFFTGSAGTGKSFLLKKIIEQLRSSVTYSKGRLVKKKVGKYPGWHCLLSANPVFEAVTASTGIAGVSIGGITLHSWAGVGINPGEPDFLVKKMKREGAQRKNADTAYKRWMETDVLIIDESRSASGF